MFLCPILHAQKNAKPLPLSVNQQHKLSYTPDSLGNRIPDFSYSGYAGGNEPVPDAPIKIIVPLTKGDATLRIQSAINYVSKLSPDKNGIRGVVLLQKGNYVVEGSLRVQTSGVVLRGAGSGEGGTIITGAGKDRETLITMQGNDDRIDATSLDITDDYVPVNATSFGVAANHHFKTGDELSILRTGTKEWIADLGTADFGGGVSALGWKPNQRNIEWTRKIVAVDGNKITIDAPITTAVDKKYGGGTVRSFTWPGRINHCGIENLQLVSTYDNTNPKDEYHRWMAIVMNNISDAWVRQVVFKHFAGSAVALYENASKITVEDCASLQPVSEIGGERRNSFFTAGEQTLFQRCYAEYGMHDFATGFCAAGPNAFVQCESHQPFSFSGGIDSWSSGVLFDVVYVDGNAISFLNRGQDGQGAGWNIANSVLWNCSAARIDCYAPPTAMNWAFGSWSQFAGNGYWGESNNSIQPRSLYYAQLKERIGSSADARDQVMDIGTEASSSPTVEQAAALIRQSTTPAKTLLEFISEAKNRNPINTNPAGIKTIDQAGVEKIAVAPKAPALVVRNGLLVRGNELVTGSRLSVPWWNGNARVYAAASMQPAITRYVPGRVGKGWTDDLDALTDSMKEQNVIGMEQNYALWYDRRRDDHERIRRMDGDVWTPFYEVPFARTGKDTAWDGLSKYDLTKYNYWYWHRLKEFADLADRKGLLLVHQNYFQHNIIEAGAHYADFTWRPANNFNNTGFPEPPPYAGDKRIFMAEQFYDETNKTRRALHRAYIRQCLDNFADNSGVIQTIGEEFTGPLHFVNFWIDMISEWEKEKNKKPLIALSVTKDVQDAVLNDPARSAIIDIIDIRYWHYQFDGKTYEPKGGQNLAPRQHARLLKPQRSSFEQVYRAVREYKTKFPSKAVIYSGEGENFGWAVLMAGGSLAHLPALPADFLASAASMKVFSKSGETKQWELRNEKNERIIYSANGNPDVDLNDNSYKARWIDPQSGRLIQNGEMKTGGASASSPHNGPIVLWLTKK